MSHVRRSTSAVAGVVVVAVLGMLVLAPSATSAPKTSRTSAVATHSAGFSRVPVSGTTGSGGAFQGVLTISRFVASGGNVAAVGTISGNAKNASGAIVRTVANAPAQLPVTAANSTCTILHLELGPLDLNLLGLMVHLDKVVLDITATQGPGQLLGNLLCALAHLLDNTSVGQGVIAQLLTAVTRLVSALGLLN